MVGDRRRRRSEANLPIEGMESLVVTVSGYKGAERFELIKLVDKAGANHVGNMNESITHLVCWKYEGKKYELARKLKILIVNHRWVEDCIREGRRVLESPYTTKCGKQVGPLVLTVSSISKLLSGYQSNLQREPKQDSDLRYEETSNTVVSDSDSLNEEWEPPKLNKHRPLREKRKEISLVQKSVASKFLLDEPPSWGSLKDKDSCSSDSGTLLGKTNSVSTSDAPSSHKGRKRRLVKKNTTKQALELSSDSEEASVQPFSFHEQHTSTSYASHYSDAVSHENVHNSDLHEFGEEFIEDIVDVDKTGDANDDEDKYLLEIASSQSQVMDAITQKVNNTNEDHVITTRLPPPAELSCVICWTDFSDTRGVLPCGHRFCFPCIQNWADHMISSGKTCSCPLCKASFTSITKMGESLPSDQKIYSQTVPVSDSRDDIYILPDHQQQNFDAGGPSGAVVCCRCLNGEPEDLLVACNMCQIRFIHSFCQDPPVFPWTCGHCKDLQMLYLRIR